MSITDGVLFQNATVHWWSPWSHPYCTRQGLPMIIFVFLGHHIFMVTPLQYMNKKRTKILRWQVTMIRAETVNTTTNINAPMEIWQQLSLVLAFLHFVNQPFCTQIWILEEKLLELHLGFAQLLFFWYWQISLHSYCTALWQIFIQRWRLMQSCVPNMEKNMNPFF
jgi:hypothetical protein